MKFGLEVDPSQSFTMELVAEIKAEEASNEVSFLHGHVCICCFFQDSTIVMSEKGAKVRAENGDTTGIQNDKDIEILMGSAENFMGLANSAPPAGEYARATHGRCYFFYLLTRYVALFVFGKSTAKLAYTSVQHSLIEYLHCIRSPGLDMLTTLAGLSADDSAASEREGADGNIVPPPNSEPTVHTINPINPANSALVDHNEHATVREELEQALTSEPATHILLPGTGDASYSSFESEATENFSAFDSTRHLPGHRSSDDLHVNGDASPHFPNHGEPGSALSLNQPDPLVDSRTYSSSATDNDTAPPSPQSITESLLPQASNLELRTEPLAELVNNEADFAVGGIGMGRMVGDDRDAHGCKGSAGYLWCAALRKCHRPWEESCPSDHDLYHDPAATLAPIVEVVSEGKRADDSDGSAGYEGEQLNARDPAQNFLLQTHVHTEQTDARSGQSFTDPSDRTHPTKFGSLQTQAEAAERVADTHPLSDTRPLIKTDAVRETESLTILRDTTSQAPSERVTFLENGMNMGSGPKKAMKEVSTDVGVDSSVENEELIVTERESEGKSGAAQGGTEILTEESQEKNTATTERRCVFGNVCIILCF
jgi:hypothetical protein